ncbi:N-acetyl-gamma-glutamyl-phosphate reductase [hydrothermal vent metagenome]|uniref:N-acetyl-gamma-glutamyl-phosphate reductase n=1 Tax=hydrothermal vent metagenome TaxID=652676 RepID=A0A3B0ZCQ6_9ZZZZ
MEKIKVGLVGGTGYTGIELLRLLSMHPRVELAVITSRSEVGKAVSSFFPSLRGCVDQTYVLPDVDVLANCDVVFYATPNGTAMQQVPALLERGVRVIDLAADFRLKDEAEWTQWYGMPHACPELLAEAVYGMPEVNRERIKNARLIANPGCYPTAVQLGLFPLLNNNRVDLNSLIADCKSGASGAGRQANVGMLMCEAGENFKAYSVTGHRHLPEIKQGLRLQAGSELDLTFVPHLTPMARGIHATLYADLTTSIDLQEIYESYYEQEYFVDVMPSGSTPETRSVRGSNVCRIAVYQPQNGRRVVILSVIDNLVKGAAGQAVHNMNIMFALNESEGLSLAGFVP